MELTRLAGGDHPLKDALLLLIIKYEKAKTGHAETDEHLYKRDPAIRTMNTETFQMETKLTLSKPRWRSN